MTWGIQKEKIKKSNRLHTAIFSGFTTGEEKEGLLCAKESVGCDCREHVLRGGVGVKDYVTAKGKVLTVQSQWATDAVSVVFSNDGERAADEEKIYVRLADGYLHLVNATTGDTNRMFEVGTGLISYSLRTPTRAVYHLYASDSVAYAWKIGDAATKLYEGEIRGAAIAGDRCFLALAERKLLYSEAFEPLQMGVDGGGELLLPYGSGDIVALEGVGRALYVFTEHSVFCLEVAASAREFRFAKLPYEGGRICRGSALATGKGILFLATTGAYFVNGGRIERTFSDVRPADPAESCRHGRCEELVMVEFRALQADGSVKARRLVFYADGKYAYEGDTYGKLGGSAFCAPDQVISRFEKAGEGVLYKAPPYFRSGALRLGSNTTKTVKEIRLRGRGRALLKLENGERAVEFPLRFENGEAKVRLLERGKEFFLTFYPQADGEVERVEVDYYRMEG